MSFWSARLPSHHRSCGVSDRHYCILLHMGSGDLALMLLGSSHAPWQAPYPPSCLLNACLVEDASVTSRTTHERTVNAEEREMGWEYFQQGQRSRKERARCHQSFGPASHKGGCSAQEHKRGPGEGVRYTGLLDQRTRRRNSRDAHDGSRGPQEGCPFSNASSLAPGHLSMLGHQFSPCGRHII